MSIKRVSVFCAMVQILYGAPVMSKSHELKATPKTVHWGYFDARLKPVLTIESGDIVRVETISGNPEWFEAGGIDPKLIPQELREIHEQVQDKGPGPHIVTGPIYIRGAEPGDILEVHLKKISLRVPFAYNRFLPDRGLLPDDFPYAQTKILRLDLENESALFSPEITIPLHPFFGILGVAPPLEQGRIGSMAPGPHTGNLDNKELVEGAIVYIPVHVRGALFSVGDGHGAQGDGEVDLSAVETALNGELQFFVRKGKRLKWPWAETPTHVITMGFNEDLDEATKMAVRNMIDYLVEAKGLNREDAYALCSLAVDLRVTQLVDGIKGIHAMLPKQVFKK